MTQETKQKFEFKKKLFKTSFLVMMLVLQQMMVFSPLTAFAQGATTTPNNQSGTEYKGPEQSIRDYLPGCLPSEPGDSGTTYTGKQSTPADNTAKDDLYKCIQTLFRFAFVAAGITAVFMFVWAGYMYMFDSGDGKRKAGGKKLMLNVIIGIVLLGCTYIFLRFINPNILTYRTFQQANITGGDHPDSIFGGGGQSVRDPATGIVIPSGTAQELAKKILNNPNISLGTDPNGDAKSGAKQNIQDTADGKPAYTSARSDVGATTVALDPAMLAGMIAVSDKYKINVSFITGGDHSDNSRHYSGKAFDVNIINGKHVGVGDGNSDELMKLCKAAGATEVLGPGSAGHDTHVHCAWPR